MMDRHLAPMVVTDGRQPTLSERLQPLLILASSITLVFTGCGINFPFGVY
ncbi:Major facilitator superfamily domain general substrate transporter [Penicillium sp. IBT 16267x]|nr:Major facilitator superfamily domain general substrate transporter [Penicillium sp. IBT 16267x]